MRMPGAPPDGTTSELRSGVEGVNPATATPPLTSRAAIARAGVALIG